MKDEEAMDLLDYFSILSAYRRFIGIFVACAFVLSVAASLILPKIYAATASVFPPQRDGLLGSGMAGTRLESGAGALAGSFFGIKSPADVWVGVLKSTTVRDALIEKFQLKERYGTRTMDETRKVLASKVSITKDKDEIIHITVEDRDPDTAAGIANAFTEELDNVNRRTSMTQGKSARLFVGKRLEKVNADLKEAEEALRKFQEKNRAVKLDEQSKAIIETMATIKGQIISQEVKLETLLSYATHDNHLVQLLEREISELKGKLNEISGGGASKNRGAFVPIERLPALASQYASLVRDVKIQEVVYELLVQQHEMALIQEARDSPTVQVLDRAVVPDSRIKPKRTKMVFMYTLSAAILSVLIAFFTEYVKRVRNARHFSS